MSRTTLAGNVADILPLVVAIDSGSRLALEAADEGGEATSLQRIVVTVDSATVLADPHRYLPRIHSARANRHLIALDGVGLDRHSATLLPLIEPDIIITAREMLVEQATFEVGAVVHALSAYVERTHAVILAEGVDTESARLAAITIGATYGTGDLYPAVDDASSLLSEPVVEMPGEPVWTTTIPDEGTPYSIVSASGQVRRGTKRLLIQLSKALEIQARDASSSMVVLGTFQQAEHFTAATSSRWRHLAEAVGFAGVYGVGMSVMLDGNVQHAPLDPEDDLVNEWTVVALGPHHAALLSARDLHDNGPDYERTFDFVQTYERSAVTQAAHAILRRYPSSNS
ncbi:DICT sensory domain-containing protein [Rhodococcus sp. C3V]|uniref:DICT sensory domain-containing protein n=1 Tax=Rhodococcus sp. C3V TaxID=3034165 RepID=UPI0031FE9BD5